MSGCAMRRWAGTATVSERNPNTAASKLLEDRLAAMRSERMSQDSAIFPKEHLQKEQTTTPMQNDPKNKLTTGK